MNTKDLVTAFGALAEICGVFHKHLLKQGFRRREALELTKTYLSITITPEKKEEV